MSDGINLLMGDKGVFRKMHMTLCFDTEEEWNALQDAVNRGNRIRWISVKDRLPENEKAVLAYAETRKESGEIRGHVVKAFYTNGKYHTEDSVFEWDTDYLCDRLRYDPENDQYYVPEGWWESVRYSDEFSAIDDFVTHWMPMPEPPKGAR